jgi:predicted hydrocarbon binding protein
MDHNTQVANKAFRAFLLGIADVLGKHGVEAVLHRANLPQYINNYPPSTMERSGHSIRFSQIAQAVYDVYGARGSRAIMQRVGRSQAEIGLQENAALVALARLGMKLLPVRQQVKLALAAAAKAINEQIGSEAEIVEEGEFLFYQARNCSYCISWKSDAPVCFAVVGFLHRLLQNITGGTEKIAEVLCRARGDEMCRFRVTLNA